MDEYRTYLVMDYLSRLKNSALCVYICISWRLFYGLLK